MMSFKSLYNEFVRHKEANWIMKPNNAYLLYSFVKENNVSRVLDLGTGIGASVAVVALALAEKGTEYRIDTIEQNEKCFTLAQDLIPKELKANISFYRTDVAVWDTPKIPYQHFANFKELPEGDWDLIITDGPGEFLLGEHLVNLPNGDVLKLHMEDKIKPKTFLFFDGRIKALATIERYYSGNFYTLEEINNKCNILERKDNPVKFFDERKDYFEKLGYFLS